MFGSMSILSKKIEDRKSLLVGMTIEFLNTMILSLYFEMKTIAISKTGWIYDNVCFLRISSFKSVFHFVQTVAVVPFCTFRALHLYIMMGVVVFLQCFFMALCVCNHNINKSYSTKIFNFFKILFYKDSPNFRIFVYNSWFIYFTNILKFGNYIFQIYNFSVLDNSFSRAPNSP